MEAATTDIVWGGLSGRLTIHDDPDEAPTWSIGTDGTGAGWTPAPPPPGAIRIERLSRARARDLLLAANGAHDLGVWYEGTWVSDVVLDRVVRLDPEVQYFPLGAPVRGEVVDDVPAISLPVLAALVDERPLFSWITDAELALAHRTRSARSLLIDERRAIEILRRWRASAWTTDPEVRFDAFPYRRGHLPGSRPDLVRQAAWAGRTLELVHEPAIVAALGLSKAHELAWAADLAQGEELSNASDIAERITDAYGGLGITDALLVARLIDELALPTTVALALDALRPAPPPHRLRQSPGPEAGVTGSAVGDPLLALPDTIVLLTLERQQAWWRRRGALLRALDAGLPHRLGSGTVLFRRGDLAHLEWVLALIDRGIRSWPQLVDLVSADLDLSTIDGLQSRGITDGDGWVVAHRAQRQQRATRFRAPQLLDAATIEEHIDALSLARLWEAGQRDFATILELHHAGLGGGDLDRFRRLGITDPGQMLDLQRRGIDGYVASILVAHGHRRPDRWPRLSPYGAVPLDEWLATFATEPTTARSPG